LAPSPAARIHNGRTVWSETGASKPPQDSNKMTQRYSLHRGDPATSSEHRPSAPGWNPLRRSAWRWVVALSIAAGGCWYYRWTEPYRVMKRLVAAVEHGDTQAIYELSDPGEGRKLSLTPAGTALAIERALPGPVRRDEVVHDPGIPDGWEDGPNGRECGWIVYWSDQRTGRPLPGRVGLKRLQLRSTVVVRPTPEGWRVPVGTFLMATCHSRWGVDQGTRAYSRIAQQAGMSGYVNLEGDLVSLESLAAGR
jgi:hypothetical protein